MEIIITILLLSILGINIYKLIPRKEKTIKEVKQEKEIDENKKKKQKELQKAFDNLMDYSIEKAIQSKRGGN